MDGLDFTILVECLLDQGDDSLSSESRVLRIEQDLSFELALIVADGAVRSIWTGISGDLNAKSLGVQVVDKPMTDTNVVVSLDGITNVGERNQEQVLPKFLASDDGSERWIGSGLEMK